MSSGWQEVRYSYPFRDHYNIVPRGAQVRRKARVFRQSCIPLRTRLATLDDEPGRKARRLTADLTCDTMEQPSLQPCMRNVRFVPSGPTVPLSEAEEVR